MKSFFQGSNLITGSQLFQPIAEISWRDIINLIISSESDTLVILDCCEAGLATVRELSRDVMYYDDSFRKELIGACTWGTITQDRMSKALCQVLRERLMDRGDTISCSALICEMNDILARNEHEDEHVPQAVHFPLQRMQDGSSLSLEKRM